MGLVWEHITNDQAAQHRYLHRNYFQAAGHYLIAIAKCDSSAEEQEVKHQAEKDLERLFERDDLLPETINNIELLLHQNKGCTDIYFAYNNAVKVDLAKAKEVYLLASKKGSVMSLRNIGALEEERKDYVEAAKYYQKALEAGYVFAKEDLNELLVKHDLDGTTLNRIALLYGEGDDVKEDVTEYIKLLKMAMRKGCAAAFSNFGFALEKGFGVTKNLLEAAL